MKRMMHPLHGFHHAMNTLEETTMRKNGWVDDVPPEPVAEIIESEQEEAPAKRAYNRKVK